MIEEKIKLKSSQELDFVKIVEDQKPVIIKDSDSDSKYVFFCKDCKIAVKTESKIFRWKKEYVCKICWSYKIVSWIEDSLKKHFRVK